MLDGLQRFRPRSFIPRYPIQSFQRPSAREDQLQAETNIPDTLEGVLTWTHIDEIRSNVQRLLAMANEETARFFNNTQAASKVTRICVISGRRVVSSASI